MSRALLIVFVLAACGDNLLIPDADRAPRVVSGGGPVLASPEVVPIFFANDPLQPAIEQFLGELTTSDYWHTATSEYGVGTLRILPSFVTTDMPPTTDDDLQDWLEAKVQRPRVSPDVIPQPYPFPRQNPNTLYVIFLPAGVTLTVGADTSCKTFGGYHSESSILHTVYALLPRCPTMDQPIDGITPALSHELIEAATDPLPNSATAFSQVDPAHLVWEFTPGGEIGDMCEYVNAAYQRLVGNFVVQRVWSNVSAAAGHDPCVPVLPGPYFGSAPALDDVVLSYPGGEANTKGVQLGNGDTTTLDLDLFSEGPTDDWAIGADDVASVVQKLPVELSFTFDKTTGNAGDVVHLHLKREKDGANGGSELVITTKVAGVVVGLWWVLVTN
jgi:hypothetical protein